MQREGFCTDQLAVTGQPYIESLWQDASKQQSSYEVLSKVLFLSQPFELIGAEGIQDHPLKVMAAALSDLAASQGRAIETKVRMHPKEVGSEAFNTMLQSLEGSACKYSLAGKKESLSDLLDWADVVVGYTTVALFEARAQGKHCIGLDIVTGKYEALRSAMRTAGIQLVAPNKEAILRALNARSNVEPVLNAFHLGATEAVIKTIQQLMPTAF
jgi:UDP-N-acetylglucosamine 2-epimerase